MGTLCDYICSSNTCNSKGVVLEQQNSATSKLALRAGMKTDPVPGRSITAVATRRAEGDHRDGSQARANLLHGDAVRRRVSEAKRGGVYGRASQADGEEPAPSREGVGYELKTIDVPVEDEASVVVVKSSSP